MTHRIHTDDMGQIGEALTEIELLHDIIKTYHGRSSCDGHICVTERDARRIVQGLNRLVDDQLVFLARKQIVIDQSKD